MAQKKREREICRKWTRCSVVSVLWRFARWDFSVLFNSDLKQHGRSTYNISSPSNVAQAVKMLSPLCVNSSALLCNVHWLLQCFPIGHHCIRSVTTPRQCKPMLMPCWILMGKPASFQQEARNWPTPALSLAGSWQVTVEVLKGQSVVISYKRFQLLSPLFLG